MPVTMTAPTEVYSAILSAIPGVDRERLRAILNGATSGYREYFFARMRRERLIGCEGRERGEPTVNPNGLPDTRRES